MNTKTQEAFNKWWDEVGSEAPTFEADMYEHCKKIALMAYQEALEQPAQEPVGFDAYSCDEGDYWHDCPDDIDIVNGRKLGEEFELLCAYQSYVMKFKITKVPDDVDDEYEVECIDEMPKLYTHPAPSWQGLSDNNAIMKLAEYHGVDSLYETGVLDFARAIEQALRSKNGN